MAPFTFTSDRKSTTCPGGATSTATSITVAAGAASDFPTGPRVFNVVATGESIELTAGWGTISWTITRHINGTVTAAIPAGAILQESIAANELTAFEQQGQELTLPDEVITGLTGSTAGLRIVGATASGAPTTGAHLVGDASLSLSDGKWYICTVAGTPGTWVSPSSGGSGTVTSVGMTVPGVLFSVSGSPITGAGTLALSLLTQNPNKVLAGPTSGADATPTVRALVAADVPAVNPSALTGSGTVPAAGLPLATTGAFGAVKPDGTTVTISAGVISSVGGGGALTTASAQLSADVTLTNANQFYDGPSVSLAAGTWLLFATAQLNNPTINATQSWTGKLWDGATSYNSGQLTVPASGTPMTLALMAKVSPTGTTTYKLSIANVTASSVMYAAALNNGAGNNASELIAVRIA